MKVRILFYIVSLIICFCVNLAVKQKFNEPIFPVIWLISLLIFSFPDIFFFLKKIFTKKIKFNLETLIIVFIIFLPIIIRVISLNPQRIHQDEFISSYYSANINFKTTNFFSGIPEDGSWVAKFPSLYFYLQKIFFVIFGATPLTLRLSILPYVLIISIMIFLITKRVLNKEAALLALIFYSFFAYSLYLETWGLHFISSTAVFLIFYYLIISTYRSDNIYYSGLTGIFCGLCYLFYLTSFIALPFMILIYLIRLIKKSDQNSLKQLLISIIAFFITLSPFVTYMINNDFYISQRINQVNIFGEWSPYRNKNENIQKTLEITKKNLLLTIKSFYTNDIGGHGGYNFGRLALFEQISLFLFIAGVIISLIIIKKRAEIFFSIIIVLSSFLLMVVLTIPPPAYHRLSLAFPYVIIFMTLPFGILLKNKTMSMFNVVLFFSVVSLFIINNYAYFIKSVELERITDHEGFRQERFINYVISNFPKRKKYIVAFPEFALKKLFYFYDKENSYKTERAKELINQFNPNEKYLYIFISSEEDDSLFTTKDKNAKSFIYKEFGYKLLFN